MSRNMRTILYKLQEYIYIDIYIYPYLAGTAQLTGSIYLRLSPEYVCVFV